MHFHTNYTLMRHTCAAVLNKDTYLNSCTMDFRSARHSLLLHTDSRMNTCMPPLNCAIQMPTPDS